MRRWCCVTPLESLDRGAAGGAAGADHGGRRCRPARPDIREASARWHRPEARVEEARRAGRFDMTLAGGYDRMTFGYAQRGFDEAGRLAPIEEVFHSVTVGAMLTLPLRQREPGCGGGRAGRTQRRAGSARGARARRTGRARRRRGAGSRGAARGGYASSVRERARQNVDVVLAAYDAGRLPLSDLLAEQRRYLEVEAVTRVFLLAARTRRRAGAAGRAGGDPMRKPQDAVAAVAAAGRGLAWRRRGARCRVGGGRRRRLEARLRRRRIATQMNMPSGRGHWRRPCRRRPRPS